MTTTPNLVMTDINEGQKNAATAVNAALQILDSTVQLWVVDALPSTTPPTKGREDGFAWIVPDSATGDWATHDRKIAVWSSGWTFLVPRRGWRCWSDRQLQMLVFTGEHSGGGRWQALQAVRVAELTDSSGGTPGATIGAVSDVGNSTDNTQINNNFATVNAKLNALYDVLITAHLMKADELTKVVDETIAIAETTVDVLNP